MNRGVFSELYDSDSDSDVPPPPDYDAELLALAALHEDLCQQERRKSRRRGSIEGHATIRRGRREGHERLYNDYFGENPVYNDTQFRRRFRMGRPLFIRIQNAVEAHDSYFIQRRDCTGRLGLSSLQKVTAAMRMLAYGVAADAVDDYVRIGESTSIESLRRFVRAIVEVFGDEYLRVPNNEDVQRLLAENEARGFPGMLGSIDCMHWKWKNCPVAWKGQYERGGQHNPSIILEAIASYDLWIWHAFFGVAGSHNDINVLDRSPLLANLVQGRTPPVNYSINGRAYKTGYYLPDGIYPQWSTFVKTIHIPRDIKEKNFVAAQESARKDVERAFGVLQSRWAIVRGPSRLWDIPTMSDIMKACIIMHNMIVEDERDAYIPDLNYDSVGENVEVVEQRNMQLSQIIKMTLHIQDKGLHCQLQADLIEHLWQIQGSHVNVNN